MLSDRDILRLIKSRDLIIGNLRVDDIEITESTLANELGERIGPCSIDLKVGNSMIDSDGRLHEDQDGEFHVERYKEITFPIEKIRLPHSCIGIVCERTSLGRWGVEVGGKDLKLAPNYNDKPHIAVTSYGPNLIVHPNQSLFQLILLEFDGLQKSADIPLPNENVRIEPKPNYLGYRAFLEMGERVKRLKRHKADQTVDLEYEESARWFEDMPAGKEIEIQPRDFLLASTKQTIKIEGPIAGIMEDDTSLLQNFRPSPLIDPYFEGRLSLKIYNNLSFGIRILKERIGCTAAFYSLSSAPLRTYKKRYGTRPGHYSNSEGAEPGKPIHVSGQQRLSTKTDRV